MLVQCDDKKCFEMLVAVTFQSLQTKSDLEQMLKRDMQKRTEDQQCVVTKHGI